MRKHLEIRIVGIVQGVGFRPFVFQLADTHNIRGSVVNDTAGVLIHAEGEQDDLERFQMDLSAKAPPLSYIISMESREIHLKDFSKFVIGKSQIADERMAFYSPDVNVCPECLAEFFDPYNRRHNYPFITCINCGPRFSIVDDIPYDRKNTAMNPFPMCEACLKEYGDYKDRRFHSQPNACPVCGPTLSLADAGGQVLATETETIAHTCVDLLQQGKVLAIKGIGGYHLSVDAKSNIAVQELRKRKRRPFKPFAIMTGSIGMAETFLSISPLERDLLISKERPIVLLKEREQLVSRQVAPGMTYMGVMLAYNPFQHLLFSLDSEMILIMTSGNISNEPIEYRDDMVFNRLGKIADYFITYNREIIGQGDDSVISVIRDTPFFIRRSRGYIPVPLKSEASPDPILATGGDLKNSFALAKGEFVIISQYLGDMGDPMTYETFRKTANHFIKIFDADPVTVVSDLHPGYLTRQFAEEMAAQGKERIDVQHHHAHIASVMEEHGVNDPVIGIAFDGTGFGTDGHLWGSEFLLVRREGFERVGHFSYFPLPGGEAAIKDVWKIGLSLLYSRYGHEYPIMEQDDTSRILMEMMEKGINSPLTCSIGRLFDGIASILGIRRSISTEAEAPMLLEEAAYRGFAQGDPFIIPFEDNDTIIIRTEELTGYVVDQIKKGRDSADIALDFHRAIIDTTVQVVLQLRERRGIDRVALSGGVFHNRILLAGLMESLESEGFTVLTHSLVPCNDGCIALGQIAVAKALLSK